MKRPLHKDLVGDSTETNEQREDNDSSPPTKRRNDQPDTGIEALRNSPPAPSDNKTIETLNWQSANMDSDDEDGIFQDADLLFGDQSYTHNNEYDNQNESQFGQKTRRRRSLASVASANDEDDSVPEEDGDNRLEPAMEPQEFTSTQVLNAEAFLTPTILDSKSMQRAVERIEKGLEKAMEKSKSTDGGVQAYLEWLAQANNITKRCRIQEETHREKLAKLMADATIQGNPRDYQRILLELAKQSNTIVHLGTGYGKTLIALLLIKDKSSDWNLDHGKKQTLFMVPSVALAIQQSMTLRANLPFSVETACYDTSNTPEYRSKMYNAQILVATHGALNDLLMHYADMFHMSRFNLVVIDECHYCAGNHPYKLIMENFYHVLPKEDRPHVLGLTASPLVSVRDKHSDKDLESMLSSLENTLDATLASAESFISDQFRRRTALEKVIQFQGTNTARWLPPADNLGLLESRFREFRQLQQLYEDLGPLPVSLYCTALIRELSRNEFENESPQAFEVAMQHLRTIIQFCEQECHTFSHHGRTDKLVALEEILEAEIEYHGGSETVGLVFTDRRITAVALHNYFRWRNRKFDEQGKERKMYCWGKSAEIRRLAWQKPVTSEIIPLTIENAVSDDVFADSEEDPFFEFEKITPVSNSSLPTVSPPSMLEKKSRPPQHSTDQFMDADDDMSLVLDGRDAPALDEAIQGSSNPDSNFNPETRTRIRSTTLVRNITSIFNSLSIERVPTEVSEEMLQSWLHVDHKVGVVLTKLRRKELNLLFATSVVEEGVDVQACSFVVAFDSIRSTKSYVQMKGRARKQNAKFYVFEDCTNRSQKAIVPLSSAQEMERRIHEFIESKTSEGASRIIESETSYEDQSSEPEIVAVRQGFFKAANGAGIVDLHSAKSLLNRYSMSVPLDPFVRTSKETLLAHMPDFRSNTLVLPSHLPARLRIVTLPEEFRNCAKREQRKVLSLMACVRLHNLGLLNDRLLPLTRSDMHRKLLLATSTNGLPKFEPRALPLGKFYQKCASKQIFIHPIRHISETFTQCEHIVQGKGHILGLVTFEPLSIDLPTMKICHKEFGLVTTTIGPGVSVMCSAEELDLLEEFFVLLMNERWRRRSRNMYFKVREEAKYDASFMPYFTGILSPDSIPDWEFMKLILLESKRTRKEREKAVKTLSTNKALPQPRLWTSSIDDRTAYLAFGPAGETVSADFPAEKEGIKSYYDYFEKERGISVPLDDQLFDVQRYWTTPSSFVSMSASVADGQNLIKTAGAKYDMCPVLSAVKVPQAACFEAEIANAHVGLLTCFLPQVLFVYERHQNAKTFIEFCNVNLPQLGSYLTRLPLGTVTDAMTAKSCGMDVSYEKLEWFGDAVLKMIQTESLLKSTELRDWLKFLHEGDLSTIRQEVGSNIKLEEVCHQFGLESYIMSSNLARGQWLPSCLDFKEGSILPSVSATNGKLYADVIESILGLVYLKFGYKAAKDVGDELKVTFTSSEFPHDEPTSQPNVDIHLIECVRRATGYASFQRLELLEEAFAHPSAGNPNVSSYERLEWVGDAVLCLAAREWIWNNFSELELSEMVTMESALVSNEALSFLSVQTGLHHFLEHKDYTLPPRIESYITCIQEDGCGLWGAEPPKSIADIVESLFGAIYTDGGISQGLRAATNMLAPMCNALLKLRREKKKLCLMHPKKALQEILGEMLELETAWENDYAAEHAPAEVLDGATWRLVDPFSSNAVGYVHFMESILFAVSDLSASIARNKACAVVVQALRSNPIILEALQQLRHRVESLLMAKARETKPIDANASS